MKNRVQTSHGQGQIEIGNAAVIVFVVTDDMTKSATGLTIRQIEMLRAIYEDEFGADPATLTPDLICDRIRWQKEETTRRSSAVPGPGGVVVAAIDGNIIASGPACACCKKQPSPNCPHEFCAFKSAAPTAPLPGKDGSAAS